MNSNNSKQPSAQQRELIKRLEEIRNRRLENEDVKSDNVDTQRTEARSPRRNEGAYQRNRNETAPKEAEQPREHIGSTTDNLYPTHYEEEVIRPAQDRRQIKRKSTQKKKKHTNPIIKQLSNSQNLAQTIVLSEVLSKPVALRNRRR